MEFTVNGCVLNRDEIITTGLNYRNAPTSILNRLKPARYSGSIVVSADDDEKYIEWNGYITAPTVSGFRGLVDDLKSKLQGTNLTALVNDMGVTRVYTVAVEAVDVRNEHYDVTAAPVHARFLAADPYGRDENYTTWSGTGINATTANPTLFSGTANPQPVFQYIVTASGNMNTIRLDNLTTGQYLSVCRPANAGWSNNKVLEISLEDKTVLYDGLPTTYSGVFPTIVPGINNIQTSFLAANTFTAAMASVAHAYCSFPNVGASGYGQSFTTTVSGTCQSVGVLLSRTGTPTSLTFKLWKGLPSSFGKLLLATVDIPVANVSAGDVALYTVTLPTPPIITTGFDYSFTLEAVGDANNYFSLYAGTNGTRLNAGDAYENVGDWVAKSFDLNFWITEVQGAPNYAVNLVTKYKRRWR